MCFYAAIAMFNPVKADMANQRARACKLQVIKRNKRVRWHQQMN